MDTVAIIALLLLAVSGGFVLGCAWAGRQREATDGSLTGLIPEQTPYSATGQLAAMDGDRVRDKQRREDARRVDLESVIWLQNPHLQYRQVRAVAERRLAERKA